jgi:NitT/TauT family transport system ATP-binding protein
MSAAKPRRAAAEGCARRQALCQRHAGVQDLSVAVGEHEFVTFLGPSGCGKSTALKMIAGLSPLSGGEIRWGDGPGGNGTRAAAISFVFQEPTLMPWSTVFDNVWLPLRLAGDRRAAPPA